MRKIIYGVVGISIGIILYIILSFNMPEAEPVNISMADLHQQKRGEGEIEVSMGPGGAITTFFEYGTYHLTDEDYDNFERRGVVKYGKVNPMFYYKLAPSQSKPEENNINFGTGGNQDFSSCDELRKVHPDGVPQGHAAYKESLDKDKDGWACEVESDNSININEKESGGELIDPKELDSVMGFNVETSRFEEIDISTAVFDFKQNGRLPVDLEYYSLSSKFGKRKDPFTGEDAIHTGIDFSAPGIEGSNVYAATHGKVVEIVENANGYGNYVVLEHNGYVTLYGHLKSISNIKVGDLVNAGTVLGTVGSTGRSTGPHLHFEIRVGTVAVDALIFINAIGKVD